MARQTEYPKIIKNGPAAVRIYQVKHKTNLGGYAYTLVWKSIGKRRLQQFASEAEAVEEGRIKVAQLAGGRIEAADMTRSDRDDLVGARELCGSIPLLAALEEWKKARELAQGQLIAAAEAWAARNGTSYEEVSIESAVDQFIAAKSRAGVDVSASYQKILPSLKKALGERSINTVSSRELSAWLEERYPHPVSRNTARKRIVTLWRWGRKQGFLPREALTEAEQTDTAREETATIGVISGATFAALLTFFREKHPEYLGALVIAGFCGLRRSEIHKQTWEDVVLDRKFVRVTAAKRNTPARRLVPLPPAAIEWLQLCPGRKGTLCMNMAVDRLRGIARDAKFDLPDNCFRHSFISHRIAQTGNVAETALEAGNSPQIIFQHYRELFSKADGKAWFQIRPQRRVDPDTCCLT